MKEQFVTYEIALKLKELGFDEKCFGRYEQPDWKDIRLEITNTSSQNLFSWQLSSAPLWQQVIDWFRRKYNWLIVVDVANSNEYYCAIREFDENGCIISKISYKTYKTYYEAREQAILKAIELLKK